MEAFENAVSQGHFASLSSRRLQRSSRQEALAKWKKIRAENPSLSEADVKALQQKEAAARKKITREANRKNGVSTKGELSMRNLWRVLRMGDFKEEIWKEKLSFVPIAHVGTFGKDNLLRLQRLHNRLVEQVRLRGGGQEATATKKHQTGVSLGMTATGGGRRPNNSQEQSIGYSGTVQLKKFANPIMRQLQEEAIATLTICIEEAFGRSPWYQAAKKVLKHVPLNRRLPNSSLPASSIWWNWNEHKSKPHVDDNAVSPCFVLTPYTYDGAALLSGASNRKIPMVAGEVVGGSWQSFPHCNDTLRSGDRYSFVVYLDYRMLRESYWVC